MPNYVQLPSYNPGGGANFEPLNQGIDSLGNALARRRTDDNNRNTNALMARGDYSGAQASTNDPTLALHIGNAQRQQGQDARAARADDLSYEQKKAQHIAGIAQMALKQTPDQRAAMMGNLYAQQPDLAQHLVKYGQDPNNHEASAKFMIAEARGFVNPNEEAMDKAKLGLIQAQTHSAYRADEPEIVRQMRAAGIDPKSAEGQDLIRNSIKGASPIDQAIAGAMKGIGSSPAQSAPQPQQPMQAIPQSAPGNALNPGVQLTAGGAPNVAQAQPQPAPPEPMADTPLGPMPASRARVLGFGLAYQGKGEAGKMFNEAGTTAKLSKGADTENDKTEIGLTNQMGRLKEISSSLDPNYLKGTTQLGMWGRQLASKWATLPEKDQAELYKYATFRKDAASNLNKVLKEVSGTAVTENEMTRMLNELPNAGTGALDGDDPVTFKAKLDRTVEAVGLAIARARHLRNQGFQGKPWESGIPIEGMRGIINQRAQQIEGQIKQQNPTIAKPMLDSQVDAAVKKEFNL